MVYFSKYFTPRFFKCRYIPLNFLGAGGHIGSITIVFSQMSRWTSVQSPLVAWQNASLKSSVKRGM